jgi:hypothetical protein
VRDELQPAHRERRRRPAPVRRQTGPRVRGRRGQVAEGQRLLGERVVRPGDERGVARGLPVPRALAQQRRGAVVLA